MQCDGGGWSLTHHAAADVICNGGSAHWDAGDGCCRGQPVRFVVATSVGAGPHVAGGEGHGGKEWHARTCLACIGQEVRGQEVRILIDFGNRTKSIKVCL